ncbi:MAG: bifunctional aldolase/short-chain dehydrogenase [Thermodesulfobacteriota bacterium]|nr:bifunctional aldolase/short-chain dehydrogenase [Thermodesulfobacteriota bacterium]
MKSLFDEAEAKKFAASHPDLPPGLAMRVYTSRLLGRNSDLVLHGGGNTSVKLKVRDVTGEEHEAVYVKGSGVDLATIGPDGFPGLDLAALCRLQGLETLADEDMANQLQVNKIWAASPDPSVDTLAHAFLPHRFVDHTHADSILVLTNQKNGAELVSEALGPKAGVLPYVRPGFPLAKRLAELYDQEPGLEVLVVMGHGLFTFGGEAREAYENMIAYVSRAEEFIARKTAGKHSLKPRPGAPPVQVGPKDAARFVQILRVVRARRSEAGTWQRFYTELRTSPELRAVSLSPGAEKICGSGVLTPDHVTRTGNCWAYIEDLPEQDGELRRVVEEKVGAYKAAYDQYFNAQARIRGTRPQRLAPYPRIFLVAGLGIAALGLTRKAARIAADIAEHTVRAKVQAGAVGEYVPLDEKHIFDIEYWGLQQKKLEQSQAGPLQGQTALVTGGGGAIALGVAGRLLSAGAAVVIADIDESRLSRVHKILADRYGEDRVESLVFDVTDDSAVVAAFDRISLGLGGLDLVVPNAGIAHVAAIEDLDPDKLDQVMAVNLKGTFNVIKASVPVFRRQGTGGNIVIISSKNVFDPGASFGAYSASKAAAHQLGKIAALELAGIGVRVNMINPDAVFGDEAGVSSKLWDLVGPDRMKSRGLDPEGLQEYYRQRNLLKVRVTAEHVGNAVVFFAAGRTPTTGATLPVDGGVKGAFPR